MKSIGFLHSSRGSTLRLRESDLRSFASCPSMLLNRSPGQAYVGETSERRGTTSPHHDARPYRQRSPPLPGFYAARSTITVFRCRCGWHRTGWRSRIGARPRDVVPFVGTGQGGNLQGDLYCLRQGQRHAGRQRSSLGDPLRRERPDPKRRISRPCHLAVLGYW
jgi:hypothetical protein